MICKVMQCNTHTCQTAAGADQVG